ncbi:MAG: CBS domain-containing protein [Gammaproteobacteria bacterium]|nr:CBS domain-containing protein [Gammaproteobacteria bacterium]
MKVQEIMTTKVESISPTTSLRHAASKMSNFGIGAMPIVEDDKVLGIITDRDISVYAIAMGHDPQSTEVQKVMVKDVVTCFGDQDIDDAARIMEECKIRRLLVLNHDNSIAGFLSVDDLANESYELAGAVLEAATPIH